MEPAIYVIVRGHVQGVGFRHYTTLLARDLNVAGWVRNLPGGDVAVLAQCPSAAAQSRFLAGLQQGPAFSRVDGLDLRAAEAGEIPHEPGFRVRS